MKKFFAIALVTALIMCMASAFVGCDKSNDKVKVVNIPLTEEEYAFCVNKSDAALLTSVNTYINQIKSDGTFDAIVNKYFGDGTPEGITAVTESTDPSNELIVATNATFEPFEYLVGNTFFGIDMEIAKGLASYLGKTLVIKNINFDAIFSEIEAGTADIGMAGITKNADREKLVQFSSSYYNASQMLVVLADNTTFDSCKTAADAETILNSFSADTKIGYQNGTTASFYVVGDEGWGFEGFAATGKGYASAALAIQDMINGNIDYVIVDEAPAKKIVEKMNG